MGAQAFRRHIDRRCVHRCSGHGYSYSVRAVTRNCDNAYHQFGGRCATEAVSGKFARALPPGHEISLQLFNDPTAGTNVDIHAVCCGRHDGGRTSLYGLIVGRFQCPLGFDRPHIRARFPRLGAKHHRFSKLTAMSQLNMQNNGSCFVGIRWKTRPV